MDNSSVGLAEQIDRPAFIFRRARDMEIRASKSDETRAKIGLHGRVAKRAKVTAPLRRTIAHRAVAVRAASPRKVLVLSPI